jgi:predicted Rossmann-fold nucleotide-binding protein
MTCTSQRFVRQEALAAQLGALIARLECDLLTGGGAGAMKVVCKAFTDEPQRAGRVIGIMAQVSFQNGRYDRKPEYPNPYVEIPIFTHLD